MKTTLLAVAAAATLCTGSGAFAQSEPFIGQLMIVASNFCPRGWANTDGQVLAISSNTALFALLGTTYGGNGQTTFALPDLRGRVPVHNGQGNGLPAIVEGEVFGTATTTLTIQQMPAHSHQLKGSTGDPDWFFPTGNLFGTFPGNTPFRMYSDDIANVNMSSQAIGSTGGNQPFDQHQPSLGIMFCIALEGVFPSRN